MSSYDDNPTPAGTLFAFWRWSPVALVIGGVVLAAIVALIIGGWQLGWWFQAQNINHQYSNTVHSQGYQTVNNQQITTDFTTLNTEVVQVAQDPSLKTAVLAQEDGTATDICSRAAQVSSVVPLPAQQASWVTANCTDGTLNTSSQYYDAGNP